MTDIVFDNTRFDPDLTSFHDHAKNMAQAFGYTAKLTIDQELAQLLRLRVAQINACAYCLILHRKAAQDQGIETARIDALASWRECGELYSETERAALAYCEALTDGKPSGFQAVHESLAALVSENQLAEIVAIIINMNVWTRLKLAQGATPRYN